MKLNTLLLSISCAALTLPLFAQNTRMETFCNPLNVDYTYMIYNSDKDISYRSGADPAVVEFRGEYYMFVTRSHGYWHSTDLQNWNFIPAPANWYPQGCNAPAAHNYKDSLLYVCGDPSGSMSVLYTDDPKKGDWKGVPAILHDLQDPDLFIDDDGKAYMFWGSSNVFPIRGIELDRNHRFLPKGEKKAMMVVFPRANLCILITAGFPPRPRGAAGRRTAKKECCKRDMAQPDPGADRRAARLRPGKGPLPQPGGRPAGPGGREQAAGQKAQDPAAAIFGPAQRHHGHHPDAGGGGLHRDGLCG